MSTPNPKPKWIQRDPHKPQVLRSGNGYYVGTRTTDGQPYARWSPYASAEQCQRWIDTNTIPYRPNP